MSSKRFGRKPKKPKDKEEVRSGDCGRQELGGADKERAVSAEALPAAHFWMKWGLAPQPGGRACPLFWMPA
jgi:hypothetical protein